MRALVGVVMALVACGDSLPPPADASPPDATGGGVVRVRVGGPDNAGLRVFFQNADSSLVLATRTAGDGTANAYIEPGGFVTVQTVDAHLWTWSGIEPGDELVLPGTPPIDPPARAALRLSVPPDPDATSLWLHTPCTTFLEVTSARLSPLEVLLPGCELDSDLLVVSRKADFSTIAHFAAALGARLGSPDDAPLVQLPGPWLPPQRSRIAVTNVPAGLAFLYAHQEVMGARDVVYRTDDFSTATIDVLGAKETFVTVPAPADARLVTYVDDPGSASGRNLRHFVTWGPPQVDTVVDVAAGDFPTIVQVPRFDRGSFAIRWTAQVQTIVPEASLVTLQLANGTRWTTLAAADAMTSVLLPVVPIPSLFGELFGAEVTSLISIRSSTGYAAYRGTLLGWSPTESWPISAPTGHVAYVQYLAN